MLTLENEEKLNSNLDEIAVQLKRIADVLEKL